MKSKILPESDLVIFDLDGTLIDSRQDLCNALNHAMALENLPPISVENMVRQISKGTKSYLRSLVDHDEEKVDRIFKAYARAYRKNPLDQTQVYPGTLELLEHLKKTKPLALMSNKHQSSCELVMEGLKINHYFEVIVGGDLIRKKPHPDALSYICDKLGHAPEHSVMIGDSVFDLQAAKAINMKCIALTEGFVDEQELRNEGAHEFYPSVKELWDSL
ncbi:MAG: HAD-IA family hydrolase [Bdellovibrionales bacterium]|nr:HAD-IA family hydrolase [Bdellovibrionales bacterium]